MRKRIYTYIYIYIPRRKYKDYPSTRSFVLYRFFMCKQKFWELIFNLSIL